jgi:hypothetical protein
MPDSVQPGFFEMRLRRWPQIPASVGCENSAIRDQRVFVSGGCPVLKTDIEKTSGWAGWLYDVSHGGNNLAFCAGHGKFPI